MLADEREVQDETGTDTEAPAKQRLDLQVEVSDAGPCRKHIRVSIPRATIDQVLDSVVGDFSGKADVPGFRKGHAPDSLLRRRFRKELSQDVKQRLLLDSLEQIAEEQEIVPIDEPHLDVENIEIPEEGNFEYEFDVEVRPQFDLPDYSGLKIERPVSEVSDEQVEAYLVRFLEQYGELEPVDEPAKAGDHLTVKAAFSHQGAVIKTIDELAVRVRPLVRFQDAELAGFDKLMIGSQVGDVRETDLTVSIQANVLAMRGEKVHATFEVLDVKRLRLPVLDEAFFNRINVDSEEDLRDRVKGTMERQVTYQQRQAVREQVLDFITNSAKWELPEALLTKQSENALRREILEMQQAGFTSQEILARENELRQKTLSTTEQNLKQHFVLDRIAEKEGVKVTDEEVDNEIYWMAMQRGENPRRTRARLQRSGMIENLEAQIRERMAVDVILESAKFTDVPMTPLVEPNVEAVNRSICSTMDVAEEEDVDEEE